MLRQVRHPLICETRVFTSSMSPSSRPAARDAFRDAAAAWAIAL
jgi:hypothetical protein